MIKAEIERLVDLLKDEDMFEGFVDGVDATQDCLPSALEQGAGLLECQEDQEEMRQAAAHLRLTMQVAFEAAQRLYQEGGISRAEFPPLVLLRRAARAAHVLHHEADDVDARYNRRDLRLYMSSPNDELYRKRAWNKLLIPEKTVRLRDTATQIEGFCLWVLAYQAGLLEEENNNDEPTPRA